MRTPLAFISVSGEATITFSNESKKGPPPPPHVEGEIDRVTGRASIQDDKALGRISNRPSFDATSLAASRVARRTRYGQQCHPSQGDPEEEPQCRYHGV